jgi:hypothetical protein
MLASEKIALRLEQIERELTRCVAEYPAESGLDRLKFTRALVRLVRSQIELQDEETVPIPELDLRQAIKLPGRR